MVSLQSLFLWCFCDLFNHGVFATPFEWRLRHPSCMVSLQSPHIFAIPFLVVYLRSLFLRCICDPLLYGVLAIPFCLGVFAIPFVMVSLQSLLYGFFAVTFVWCTLNCGIYALANGNIRRGGAYDFSRKRKVCASLADTTDKYSSSQLTTQPSEPRHALHGVRGGVACTRAAVAGSQKRLTRCFRVLERYIAPRGR